MRNHLRIWLPVFGLFLGTLGHAAKISAPASLSASVQLVGSDTTLWEYVSSGNHERYAIANPVINLDGHDVALQLQHIKQVGVARPLANGCSESVFSGEVKGESGLTMQLTFRVAKDNDPVVRFRYELRSSVPRRLTKPESRDRLEYLATSLSKMPAVTELRISEFNEQFHSYMPVERALGERYFADREKVMGPILIAGDTRRQFLLAYEHGSTAPDSFLTYSLAPDHTVHLQAVKGNYWDGQELAMDKPFCSIWFEIAAVTGTREDMARSYRDFVLRHLSETTVSREPRIFYNTWNYQERLKAWKNKPYLSEMSTARMLSEIEAAHKMGIEVFVIDTGWYQKTGDWQTSKERFPDELRQVKAKLDGYGMKLGLWFAPTTVALSSRMLKDHEDCVMTWDGKRPEPWGVWESEKSIGCCVVSRYGADFADELIRLNRELGVTYFKWDAVNQYGCNAAGHGHGTETNSFSDRSDCYAFQMPLAMARIAERVSASVPDAICDFDMTESGRPFGLAFLTAGKYFLVNNGPYYQNYDHPLPPDGNWNLFFRPGPARTWICRGPLTFDQWIPSSLFLTHYLPDDPIENQLLCIGSLILGQNGIWGDLPAISSDGLSRFGTILGKYKQVRQDVVRAFPVTQGPVAGTPEVHEKIAPNGRGEVVIFAAQGTHHYITAACPDHKAWQTDGAAVSFDDAGHAIISASFAKPGAQIVFFGVE